MPKLTSLWVVIMLMIFLGITSVAEARTGKTSDSSQSSSSKSRTTSSSKSSTTSSSSSSKPTKTTSATDSIFANVAKANEARKAWQERNKKVDIPVASVPVPVQDNTANRQQEQQLNAIQKQIADAKRQQQIIAAAQTAAQIAINNNKRPTVTPAPVTPMPPVSNLPNTPVNTAVTQPAPAKSGGTSWFMIFLVVGGIVLVIFWLKKRNSSNTIYRL